LSSTLRPTTPRSPPKRDCQSWWLMIATGGAPGWSSSTVKARPTTGVTPSTRGRFQLTRLPGMRVGSPSGRSGSRSV
jgi:hypothetical protein